MAEQALKSSIQAEVKTAMKARDKERLATLRLIMAEIKRVEVDERIDVDDQRLLAILDKMVKQRRDSIQQYTDGGRDELAAKEAAEIDVIGEFLPKPLSDDEIAALIDAAIADTGAASMQEMGKVMGALKPQLAGRADMGKVSATVRARLGA